MTFHTPSPAKSIVKSPIGGFLKRRKTVNEQSLDDILYNVSIIYQNMSPQNPQKQKQEEELDRQDKAVYGSFGLQFQTFDSSEGDCVQNNEWRIESGSEYGPKSKRKPYEYNR